LGERAVLAPEPDIVARVNCEHPADCLVPLLAHARNLLDRLLALAKVRAVSHLCALVFVAAAFAAIVCLLKPASTLKAGKLHIPGTSGTKYYVIQHFFRC
jgi:hypothetical protein